MIKNEAANTVDSHVSEMRSAFEHRAMWFGLMIDEAKKKGLDTSFARDAIMKCGCYHGTVKYPQTDDIKEFEKAFVSNHVVDIFDMDITTTDEEMNVVFHYCPLVKAWQNLGFDDATIAEYCDIAMDGDRGIVQENPNFEFFLGDTIGKGCETCLVKVSKK